MNFVCRINECDAIQQALEPLILVHENRKSSGQENKGPSNIHIVTYFGIMHTNVGACVCVCLHGHA